MFSKPLSFTRIFKHMKCLGIHLTKKVQNMYASNHKTPLCQFPMASITKYQTLCSLKQQKFIVSQFWRVEVQNQGVSSAMLILMSLGKNPSLSLLASGVCPQSLAFFHLQVHHSSHIIVFSLNVFRLSSFCECLSLRPNFPFLIGSAAIFDQGLPLRPQT